MTIAKGFDLLSVPLEGTNLTEASAGTGKTYTIAGLFLRLILEKNLSVDRILVVTFTEAATGELKERIRGKLRDGIKALSEDGSEDPLLDALVKRHKTSKTALPRLKEALRAFDQAAISTIHGFCWRILHQNAFESGSLFDTELIADQGRLTEEVVHDFWRRHFYEASPLFVRYVIDKKSGPATLMSLFEKEAARPYLKIVPETKIPDTSREEKAFHSGFQQVRQAWRTDRQEVITVLTTDEGLSRVKYPRASIAAWVDQMDDLVAEGGKGPLLFESFGKFTTEHLQQSVKKGCQAPVHRFFGFCQDLRQKQKELVAGFEHRLLGLKVRLFHELQDELVRRKEKQNVQSFDDLLLKLHRALEGKGGEQLAQAIRAKYKAALIDEFQDTDPIQYAIFKRIFDTETNILFLIGDPKQAIYSFRGADVFAYMEAAGKVKAKHTLSKNWRSEPGLVKAINTIFSRISYPFVYRDIPFVETEAADQKEQESLSVNGQVQPPFRLWFVKTGETTGRDRLLAKVAAREKICDAVAGEIARLVGLGRKRRVLLGDRPIGEGDIAVLVRKNMEARLAQKALSKLDIPSVLYSAENLFDSREALEVERVLTAVAEPNGQELLKAALATDMMGLSGEALDILTKNATRWEEWTLRFKKYHDLWKQRGFIQAFRLLLLEEQVLVRLMSLDEGERRSTNVLHLSEVLHRASIERRLGMSGLLKWFSEQRDPASARLDEHQLRLERDENAVKIVTIHRSKGLEYPIVFCPFAWDGSRLKNGERPFTFHDEADNMRPTLDLGSEAAGRNRFLAEKELLAENLRLLYVALTRAKNRCYLVWGRFRGAETSALAYLFHQSRFPAGEDFLTATGDRFKGLSEGDLLEELEAMAAGGDGAIKLQELPSAPEKGLPPSLDEAAALSCRQFHARIDRSWKISSFSSLISGQMHGQDLADRDAVSEPLPIHQQVVAGSRLEKTEVEIFDFPRGTRAGMFVHDVFEHLDFADKDGAAAEKLVTEKLVAYGFETTWKEVICRMIRKVLAVPLDPARPRVTLSRIQNKDRLNELGFYFPLKTVSSHELKTVIAHHSGHVLPSRLPDSVDRLEFSPVRGFMKGFVDLVFQFERRFYLVDWKSNFLGDRVEDYGPAALAGAMAGDFYFFQYLLYVVALDQYLRFRLPGYSYEENFGGIYYIFVRGVDPDLGTDYGIFRDRPPSALVEKLSETLIDRGRMTADG
jgi:exodeoxyribonuclease V beta subunit